jgi:hypothetical protein
MEAVANRIQVEVLKNSVEIRLGKTEIVKSMDPGQSIEIEESRRSNYLNAARMSMPPSAKFVTRKQEGKTYLIRLS